MGQVNGVGANSIVTGRGGWLKNKQILGRTGKLIVPAGVTTLYYTGVAAGGYSGAGTPNPWGGWSSSSNRACIGISENENYIFAANGSGGATTAPILDPAGRKASLMGTGNGDNIAANAGGSVCLAADNGFLFTYGSGGVLPKVSLNGGTTWSSPSGAVNCNGTYNGAAIMPVSPDDATDSNRLAMVTSTATTLSVWAGAAFVSSAYSGKSFTSMSYANGYFIAGENNATTKMSLYYRLAETATTAAGWASVVIDAVNNYIIQDVHYANGIYVAVANSDRVYTATSLAGPWVGASTTSGGGILGIKYANGKWVGVTDNGKVISATDPTGAWTVSAAINGSVARYRNELVYMAGKGYWCITQVSTNELYYSSDAVTWTAWVGGGTITSIKATASGLLAANGAGAAYLIRDPSVASYITLSTSADGGDARIVRTSTGKDIYRLAGGLKGSTNAGGDGGSSTGVSGTGSSGSSNSPAGGIRGQGGAAHLNHGCGTGGISPTANTATTNFYGGGGCPFIEDLLLSDGMDGVKIPGGGGAGWTAGILAGGGGSIMAQAASGAQSAIGPGGGMGSSTAGAGAGGEGVVRAAIPVTPGETLGYGVGLAQIDTYVALKPQHGFGMFEWE